MARQGPQALLQTALGSSALGSLSLMLRSKGEGGGLALNLQKRKNFCIDCLCNPCLMYLGMSVCLHICMYIETFNQVGQSKSALFMQLSISGIPPECAAFARTSIGVVVVVVVVCLVYMYIHSVYICICILSVYLAFAMAHWQPVVDAVDIYKDSSIELNVINMRTQTSLVGRGGGGNERG